MQQQGPLSGYRFLVVEDEAMQAAYLGEMILESGGTVSRTVHNYQQARQALDDATFDCAMLDINLGGTLSFTIADALRARGIPFVVCTAYADAVDVHPGAWAAPRLNKPIQLPELQEAVLEALESAVVRD
jgi:CheY-like chemotaxis protein